MNQERPFARNDGRALIGLPISNDPVRHPELLLDVGWRPVMVAQLTDDTWVTFMSAQTAWCLIHPPTPWIAQTKELPTIWC